MRKAFMTTVTTLSLVLVPASGAGATHTGCEHARTGNAHGSVPHKNHGTHNAHGSIPYCPPEDAPRHRAH